MLLVDPNELSLLFKKLLNIWSVEPSEVLFEIPLKLCVGQFHDAFGVACFLRLIHLVNIFDERLVFVTRLRHLIISKNVVLCLVNLILTLAHVSQLFVFVFLLFILRFLMLSRTVRITATRVAGR